MKVLVTGANGFIGRNLVSQLETRVDFDTITHTRSTSEDELRTAISEADFVCHMAGVNRPLDEEEFNSVNAGLTRRLCNLIRASGRSIPVIFSSSVHVERDNAYGRSKLVAERILTEYAELSGAPVYIFRLPHVIGKWCRPDYNSVVATFCHRIARDLPIQIDNPEYHLSIVYIDDLVETFTQIMSGKSSFGQQCVVSPAYDLSVGELARILRKFRSSRESLEIEAVGSGLLRALFATYASYLPPDQFAYPILKHADSRGVFVEMLKTHESGQFSYFTANPGVTRGGHYHHTKTEKFLVIRGEALFRFRHIVTGEYHEVLANGNNPLIVETIPGWTHDITNVGDDEMVVMLWANEKFDRDRPDTFLDSVVK